MSDTDDSDTEDVKVTGEKREREEEEVAATPRGASAGVRAW